MKGKFFGSKRKCSREGIYMLLVARGLNIMLLWAKNFGLMFSFRPFEAQS
jgi:hypothetical protein